MRYIRLNWSQVYWLSGWFLCVLCLSLVVLLKPAFPAVAHPCRLESYCFIAGTYSFECASSELCHHHHTHLLARFGIFHLERQLVILILSYQHFEVCFISLFDHYYVQCFYFTLLLTLSCKEHWTEFWCSTWFFLWFLGISNHIITGILDSGPSVLVFILNLIYFIFVVYCVCLLVCMCTCGGQRRALDLLVTVACGYFCKNINFFFNILTVSPVFISF